MAGAKKGDDYDVIPSLMDVLSEAIESRGKTRKQLAFVLEVEPKTIKRYFEWEHFPAGAELDRVVAAASVLTGRSRFALWRDAVKAAEDRVKKLPSDPQLDAARVVLSLPPAESE